jgi:hypothetical protein
MRVGYAVMGFGLAVVKWPLVINYDQSLPLFEGVVAVLLTAMSLLAFLGLRYPVRLLPILILECLWKVIWLGMVALPAVAAGMSNPGHVPGDRQLLAGLHHRCRRSLAVRRAALRHGEGGQVAMNPSTRTGPAVHRSPARSPRPGRVAQRFDRAEKGAYLVKGFRSSHLTAAAAVPGLPTHGSPGEALAVPPAPAAPR